MSSILYFSLVIAVLIEHLRSYENYGQAVFWVTQGAASVASEGGHGLSWKNHQKALELSARRALNRAAEVYHFKVSCLRSVALSRNPEVELRAHALILI